ncbi:glycoside hydrolase superfamily [Zopfochytrium polystomum]|nr:glycoside hydrolase superfamily [Zopfochytrium polystomum]
MTGQGKAGESEKAVQKSPLGQRYRCYWDKTPVEFASKSGHCQVFRHREGLFRLLGLLPLTSDRQSFYGLRNWVIAPTRPASSLASPPTGPTAGTIPGKLGTNYFAPNPAAIAYTASKFANLFRVNFAWERLQPTPNGPLDSAYLSTIQTAVKQIKSAGAIALLDVHNYARYNGQLLAPPSSSSSSSPLADLWRRVAGLYANDPQVFFGVMNEPSGIDAVQWFSVAQAAVDAIRAAGANNTIMVPGNCYTGAHSWVAGNCDVTGVANGKAALALSDPTANNVVFEMHQYLDADYSGTHPNCTHDGAQVLAAATAWLRANARRGFLGEIGGATSAKAAAASGCLAQVERALTHLRENADVWTGFAWWAAGSGWGSGGGFAFSIEAASDADAAANPMFQLLTRFRGSWALA